MTQSFADTFKKMIMMNTEIFAEVAAKNIYALLQVESRAKPVRYSEDGIDSKNNIYVSILFTGIVYGEFIFALNSEMGAKFIGKSTEGLSAEKLAELNLEISEIFSEILNITSGEAIRGLTEIYQKVTVTAPRVYFGKVGYPRVKTGKTALMTKFGEIECFLYVDQMKLDIAESYKSAMVLIVNANRALRTAYEKLKEQQAHLVQTEKLAALGVMAKGVAHEINTPLTNLLINESELKKMLANENFDREIFSTKLNVSIETVEKITKITQSLQAYAVSNTSTEDEFRPVSVNSILDIAVLCCEQRLKESGVQLIPFRFPETASIGCYSEQLAQAIYNLLANAEEAVAHLPEKWIRIEGIEKDDSIEIGIIDSGVGISPDHQKKLFDPFFTTKEFGEGVGLGLSMAKGIIDIHQGKISLDTKSKNTKFIVRLPKMKIAA